MVIDMRATHAHYVDHLLPVWDALPPEHRGTFMAPRAVREALRVQGHDVGLLTDDDHGNVLVIAGMLDLPEWRVTAPERVVWLEHGAGQRYGEFDPLDADHVGTFLVPNQQAKVHTQATYPDSAVHVVGCPKLDGMKARRKREGRQGVGFAFHWDQMTGPPETSSAWPHYEAALREIIPRLVDDGVAVYGHGHPKQWGRFEKWWRKLGVAPIESFPELLDRVDIYCTDNSSTLFEAAWLGLRTIALDSPTWDHTCTHGLRFWDVPDTRCTHPDKLAWLLEWVLDGGRAEPWDHTGVYPHTGPTKAVERILGCLQ